METLDTIIIDDTKLGELQPEVNEVAEYIIIKQVYDIHESTWKPIKEILDMDWEEFKSYKF